MGRREQRESIFQLLFMTEFNDGEAMNEQQTLYLEGIEDLKERDRQYIQEKFQKINENLSLLDERLNETSKGWKTTRMNKVDLTILRLAFYEILFDEDVPQGVAINEAVELAKKFGGNDSSSFVNGVLARLVKQQKAEGEEKANG
ncbi:MAG: transcription antitermination factor NusB [Oliverpabstia sp.]|nr:transcription antitermination factor NusB [Oliverpabstia sp.]